MGDNSGLALSKVDVVVQGVLTLDETTELLGLLFRPSVQFSTASPGLHLVWYAY